MQRFESTNNVHPLQMLIPVTILGQLVIAMRYTVRVNIVEYRYPEGGTFATTILVAEVGFQNFLEQT